MAVHGSRAIDCWQDAVRLASREPVISGAFWGDRFFVLYLGGAAANCQGACFGAVTLKFERGSTIDATISFSAPGTSTAPLPFTIPPSQFSGNHVGI
jgi:hypothetical protein